MAWIVIGIILSALLSAIMANIPGFGSPGDYVVHWLYPSVQPRSRRDVTEVLWVMLGTNFIVSFVVLSILFVIVSRLLVSKSRRV